MHQHLHGIVWRVSVGVRQGWAVVVVGVNGPLIIDDMDVSIRAAIAGGGLAYSFEQCVGPSRGAYRAPELSRFGPFARLQGMETHRGAGGWLTGVVLVHCPSPCCTDVRTQSPPWLCRPCQPHSSASSIAAAPMWSIKKVDGASGPLIRERRLPIVRDDIGRLPLIHIDDVVSAPVRAADRASSGAVHDIVDDRPVGLAEIVVQLSECAGAAPACRVPAWVLRLVSPYMSRLISVRMPLSNARAKLERGWCPAFRRWGTDWRICSGGQCDDRQHVRRTAALDVLNRVSDAR
jgi:hypothetical protein